MDHAAIERELETLSRFHLPNDPVPQWLREDGGNVVHAVSAVSQSNAAHVKMARSLSILLAKKQKRPLAVYLGINEYTEANGYPEGLSALWVLYGD